MRDTPMATLTVRELICLLAGTEEQIWRLCGGQASIDESHDTVRDLVREQDQVIGELRRRHRPAT